MYLVLAGWLDDNWFGVVSLIAGLVLSTIVAIVIAIVSHVRGKKLREPACSIYSENIIHEDKAAIPELTIHFARHSEPLKNLSVAKVYFWNAGKEMIGKGDIIGDEPPVITMREGLNILSVRVVGMTDSTNRFEVQLNRDKDKVTLSFEYLNYGHGGVVQVFHTGQTRKDVIVQAKLKNSEPLKIFRDPLPGPERPLPRNHKTFMRLMVAMFVLTLALAGTQLLPKPEPEAIARLETFLGIVYLVAAAFIACLFAAYVIMVRRMKLRVPAALREPPEPEPEPPPTVGA